MSQEGNKTRIVEYLHNAGYKAEIDKDGDIMFVREGLTTFIQLDDDVYRVFSAFAISNEKDNTEVAFFIWNVMNANCPKVKITSDLTVLRIEISSLYSNVDEFLKHLDTICVNIRETMYQYEKVTEEMLKD